MDSFKFHTCLVAIVVFLSSHFITIRGKLVLDMDNTTRIQHPPRIKERFFPFFSVVRFANSECVASSGNLNGTCFTRGECYKYGGTPLGTCASGHGSCCVFQKTCGSSTNVNNTYFTSPQYPRTYAGGEKCTITINRCNSYICQLRLDFLESSLAQPNSSGICDYDYHLISGTSSQVPRICGENANRHVYVDFNGASPITLSTVMNQTYAMDRRWNIRIQQIACDSIWRAPSGCLQYYKAVSDTVSSFNYGTAANSRGTFKGGNKYVYFDTQFGTRLIANTNYGVCVRVAQGYCGIEWSQTDANSFSISGGTGAVDAALIGTAYTAESGTNCTSDFIIIPNPFEYGTAVGTDRFCGNSLIKKISYLKPFVLYVVTNGEEEGDTENKGFMLTYQQVSCLPY